MDLELALERARIIRETRAFFDNRDYLEVDTPLLAPDLIPETCLEVFETAYVPPRGSRRREEKLWLIPSPEIWMKKLIARYRVSMYQICKCFRNTESRGRLHSPEFTMLEYYTMDADYLDSLALTEELFRRLLEPDSGRPISARSVSVRPGLRPPFLRITMEEAFSRWAGFSLYEAAEAGTMEAEARRLGLNPPSGLDTAALYDLIFIHAVEPALPRDKPVVLLDYPAFVPCLAKKNSPALERWELYAGGIELANCYSEETDPEEVRRYFKAETAEKEKNALIKHETDPRYWENFLPRKDGSGFPAGFPACSGVALGLDRLVMALTGRPFIEEVLFFSESMFSSGKT
ncbi:MAG: LysR family transcriptional regulator [Spirochaetaceae bacterium]|jgi:lysyl-tRNA synthetase class 2|nr:LysR family transcriptional regulator [Spirochaetaceae bacterium]